MRSIQSQPGNGSGTFLECVRSRGPKTICDAGAGLVNTATMLMANQAIAEHKTVSWPQDLAIEKPQP